MDEDIKQSLDKLEEVFNHEAVRKVKSHIFSLSMKIETLIRQRDSWKEKFIEAKEAKK